MGIRPTGSFASLILEMVQPPPHWQQRRGAVLFAGSLLCRRSIALVFPSVEIIFSSRPPPTVSERYWKAPPIYHPQSSGLLCGPIPGKHHPVCPSVQSTSSSSACVSRSEEHTSE